MSNASTLHARTNYSTCHASDKSFLAWCNNAESGGTGESQPVKHNILTHSIFEEAEDFRSETYRRPPASHILDAKSWSRRWSKSRWCNRFRARRVLDVRHMRIAREPEVNVLCQELGRTKRPTGKDVT